MDNNYTVVTQLNRKQRLDAYRQYQAEKSEAQLMREGRLLGVQTEEESAEVDRYFEEWKKGQTAEKSDIPQEVIQEAKAQNSVAELLKSLPKSKADSLLDELSEAKQSDAAVDAVEFLRSKISQEQTQESKVNLDALWKEYNERLAQIPNGKVYAVLALKREMRRRGLPVY